MIDLGLEVNHKRVQPLMQLMGIRSLASPAFDDQVSSGSPQISLPAVQPEHSSTQPRVVRRYHLHSVQERFPLLGGNHGPSLTQGAVMASVQRNDGRLLRGRSHRGPRHLRHPRYFQHRPRCPVHIRHLHRHLERGQRGDLHGRGRKSARQRLHQGTVSHTQTVTNIYLNPADSSATCREGISEYQLLQPRATAQST
jgi:hypothetical protein